MVQAALVVLLVALTCELIQYVGYSYFVSQCYKLYKLAIQKSSVVELRKYKKEIIELKTKLRQTSSQDEFAKWARIRRKLDAATSKYDKLATDLAYDKTGFEVKMSIGSRVVLYGARILVVLWYRYEPMFYLPQGWFSPITFVFSYPAAPTGSVSVLFWFLICQRVVHRILISLQLVQSSFTNSQNSTLEQENLAEPKKID
ncbi:GET complex subunit get1 [Basidiobolus ranarum]|uniref:GET complex subunit get1 n=1 Tax=Basidiobolus ranarum TaxID=34480 RepID=A0ABR2WPX1_9FUNG